MKYMKPCGLYEDLLKLHAVERGRLLGLHVGKKNVNLAVSDLNHKFGSPLSVLDREKTNIDQMAIGFQNMISKYSVSAFIFGYPYNRLRTIPNAQVSVFIDELSKTGKLEDVRYTFWDASFSSKTLADLMEPMNIHPKEAKRISDKFAVAGILQGYLDFVNRKIVTEQSK